MALVAAKCTNCGGKLEVDNAKRLANCIFCKEPFVIQEAINNYITNVTNNIKSDVTHVYNQESADVLYQNGRTYLGLSEVESAKKIFIKMTEMYPSDWRGWYGMIQCHKGWVWSEVDSPVHKHYSNMMKLIDEDGLNKIKEFLQEFEERKKSRVEGLKDLYQSKVDRIKKEAKEINVESLLVYHRRKINRKLIEGYFILIVSVAVVLLFFLGMNYNIDDVYIILTVLATVFLGTYFIAMSSMGEGNALGEISKNRKKLSELSVNEDEANKILREIEYFKLNYEELNNMVINFENISENKNILKNLDYGYDQIKTKVQMLEDIAKKIDN